MILITVGTEKFPFNRLMQWIENLVEQGFIQVEKEKVIVQYGSCTILPHGAKNYSILPEIEFKTLVQQARLIIAHCGEGTVDLLSEIKTPFILVPRSHRFGEHVDDHQIELAESLAELGLPIAYSPGDLVRFLASPERVQLVASPSNYYTKACPLLNEFILQNQRDNMPIFALNNIFARLASFFKVFFWNTVNT